MSFRFCRRYFSVDMLRACKLEKERTISDGETNRYVARLCRQVGKQLSRYSLCICGRAEHCSCFAVVCLHTSLGVFSLQHTFLWTFQELMQAMFIFAVPIFFMVSGMNLLDYRKKYSTKVFFKKRFVRVGRALILGSIACYLLFGLLPGLFYGAQSIADGFGPVDFCKRFLTNSIIDIYWFLYTIIYLYLLTPLLSKIVHDRRLLEYAIALTLFCSILIPAAKAIGINEEYFSPLLSWPLFASSALLYFLLGYYLENYGLPLHWNALAWAATFLGSVTLMFLGGLCWNGFFQNSMGVEYQNYLVGISSPLCVISAVSLFMLCKALEPSLQRGSDRMKSIIRKVSSVSLGVYMFHLLLVNLTLGGPFERILTFGQYHPFIKAIAVYLLTGIAVYVGKWCISKVKRALLSK